MSIKQYIIVREIIANHVMKVPFIRSWRVKKGRTTDSLDKKFHIQEDQLFKSIDLKDKVVLELGPGDSVPMAWLCYMRGAKRYIALDRFMGEPLSELAQNVHKTVDAPANFPAEQLANGQMQIVRQAVEDCTLENVADVIFSFNVVEHLNDVTAAFKKCYQALRPNGVMIHRVDLSPHQQWRTRPNSLEWLTISDTIWELMGSARGTPNRVRFGPLRRAVEEAGFNILEFNALSYFRENHVAQIRHKLPANWSEDDLRVSCVLIKVEKPS